MTPISYAALQAVLQFDYREHVLKGGINRTRFYLWLAPHGEDMEIRTVACRAPSRWKAVEAKEVIRASVDAPKMYVKDLAYCRMAGYQVDWSPEGGRQREWSYGGRWQAETYSRRCSWKLHGRVVNPEALQETPRFRYCAWTPVCGHPLDWLKAYVAHPRIELLAKAGIGWLGQRTGLVTRMERNKDLMRWVMGNLEDLKKVYTIPALNLAYKTGVSLMAAEKSILTRRRMLEYGMPKQMDADRVAQYTKARSIYERAYCTYLRHCVRLGLDLSDTKTAYPRDFGKRRQIVADQVAEIERRENAEKAKKMDAEIAATAKRFARCERRRGSLALVLARKTAELIREGKRLHNCLGDGHYAAKMARGETVIAFVRRSSGTTLVAVEWSPAQKRVLQCYGTKNSKPPKPILTFVNRCFGGKAA